MAAFGKAGRAAGWDKLTNEQMALIKEKFIPFAPRWGSTGYEVEDKWLGETFGNNRCRECKIGGTQWSIITASGKPVVTLTKTLEDALATYKTLPEAERKPKIEDRGPHNPNLQYADQHPPEGTVFIDVFCRPLVQEADGQYKLAQTVDLTEFGGRQWGNSMPNDYSEPQRESLWLTREEAQSLVPEKLEAGVTQAVAAPIRQRIFLFYLYNWFSNSGGGFWGPRHIQEGDLNVTVVEVSGDRVRLRLEGHASFKATVHKQYEAHGHLFSTSPRETGQKNLPEPYEVTYDPKIYGELEYDLAKMKFVKFDAVALGDYRGNWGLALKLKPVPVGFAFRLDSRDLPLERRHAPFGISAAKENYWAPEPWKGR
jgi:hypothetical protein